jgi:hypothetical protein
MTPMDRYFELLIKIPFRDEMQANYDPKKKLIREQP